MEGDKRIDALMIPVYAAIKRHVKNRDAITDIYNRAYEALMNSMDALDVSAAVTAKQIAENAKNLQRAEKAEVEIATLQSRLAELEAALKVYADYDNWEIQPAGYPDLWHGSEPGPDVAERVLEGGE